MGDEIVEVVFPTPAGKEVEEVIVSQITGTVPICCGLGELRIYRKPREAVAPWVGTDRIIGTDKEELKKFVAAKSRYMAHGGCYATYPVSCAAFCKTKSLRFRRLLKSGFIEIFRGETYSLMFNPVSTASLYSFKLLKPLPEVAEKQYDMLEAEHAKQ